MSTDTMIPGTEGAGRRAATAFFDSREAAEQAKADLVAAGIREDAISIAGDAETKPVEPDAPILPEEGGFWHALKEFFMPDEDRYTYAEGLRRGGMVLSVQADEATYDRVLDILDADGAVDIDAREQAWKMDGWAGWQEGIDPLGGGLSRPDNSTAGFGASVAGEDGYQPPAPHAAPPVSTEPASTTSPPTTPAPTAAAPTAPNASLTTSTDPDAAARADVTRVGTGPGEPGALNPDMRERIGSGTASMTPPTPTGAQDATLAENAALERKAAIEDASLGNPTRSGFETPAETSTIGDYDHTTPDWDPAPEVAVAKPSWDSRRDSDVQRGRVRGFIIDRRS